jgi:preprotein translocase subunit SecD
MMNRYPIWKYLLIALVLLVGVIYALPNLYGEDPALQISPARGAKVDAAVEDRVKLALSKAQLTSRAVQLGAANLLVRFADPETQLKAQDVVQRELGDDYVVALNLAPTTPAWLRAIGAKPMYLGLDLRGGVHFLMEVDMDAVIKQTAERYVEDMRTGLRTAKIHYTDIARQGDGVELKFKTAEERNAAREALAKQFSELVLSDKDEAGSADLMAVVNPQQQRETRKFAVEQNITTLRNRVNELGVAEPVIQQQGENRIVVELPGVQDTARAKEILGATATLEFHMVDEEHNAAEAATGHVPIGSRLYRTRKGEPVLLHKRMFIENKTETHYVDGKAVKTKKRVEEVINRATIRGTFSKRFQITGLDSSEEARDLALLLRAGALAAPVDIIEERTVGPSLGQENIDRGFMSCVIGFVLVMVFMTARYKMFGLFASAAQLVNLVLIIAVLSLLQATLTLPGIAGIVLTVGMAVDANVLIDERIREELRSGNSPFASIEAGYERALGTIADSNITTLIAGLMLFVLGSGPVKGFAVVLCIGILTSMFTALMGTRALVYLVYGGRRRIDKLAV